MPHPDSSCAQTVPCRRQERPRTPAEHRDCPWCFGTRAEVCAGDHARFCDWQPGADPAAFGFPPAATRFSRG